MNPLNKIGEGIKKQDWGLVCEGYNAMTGQDLSVPTQIPKNDTLTGMSALELFKQHIQQSIAEFEVFPTPIDEPDTESDAVEEDDHDRTQPADDDEENVDFKAVTSEGDGVGLYGNKTMLITETPTAKQVEINKKRAADRETPKVSRPPPKTHEVECTDCGNTFDSPVRAGEFGQKCPKCLRSTNRER